MVAPEQDLKETRQPHGDLREGSLGRGRTVPKHGLRETLSGGTEGSEAQAATQEAGGLAGQGLDVHWKG